MDEVAKKSEIERLLQVRRVQVIEKPTDRAFVCIYSSDSLRDGFHCFSYLLPADQKEQFLSDVKNSLACRAECQLGSWRVTRNAAIFLAGHREKLLPSVGADGKVCNWFR